MSFLLFLLKFLSLGCDTLLRVVTVCGTKSWTSVRHFKVLQWKCSEIKEFGKDAG